MKITGSLYDSLANARAKVVILYGSAGASKSYTMAQYLLIERFLKGINQAGLITRKVNASLPFSTYKLVIDLLREMQVPLKNKNHCKQFLMVQIQFFLED